MAVLGQRKKGPGNLQHKGPGRDVPGSPGPGSRIPRQEWTMNNHNKEEMTMTKFYETIIPKAQEELIRDGIIGIVCVCVDAVPDPISPGDWSAITFSADVYHDFRDGVPAIDAGIARIREICSGAAEDISPAVKDRLRAALAIDRKQKDEFRMGRIDGEPFESRLGPEVARLLRPENLDLDPKVSIWCHAWTAGMSDNGLMCIDRDEPVIFKGIDHETEVRILERITAVDERIAAIIGPLMREG